MQAERKLTFLNGNLRESWISSVLFRCQLISYWYYNAKSVLCNFLFYLSRLSGVNCISFLQRNGLDSFVRQAHLFKWVLELLIFIYNLHQTHIIFLVRAGILGHDSQYTKDCNYWGFTGAQKYNGLQNHQITKEFLVVPTAIAILDVLVLIIQYKATWIEREKTLPTCSLPLLDYTWCTV